MAAVTDAGSVASGERPSAEDLKRSGRRGTAVVTSVTDIAEIGDLGLGRLVALTGRGRSGAGPRARVAAGRG